MNFQNKPIKDVDARVGATTRIWAFATAMMGMCIPIVSAAIHIGYIATVTVTLVPLSVLVAASFGTAVVWKSAVREPSSSTSPTDLKQLEERMANLEIIHRYENALQAEKEINTQLRAQHKSQSPDEEPRKLAML